MTAGTIEFACPYCDRVTRVPATFGGKQGKCPGCQKVIEVPAVDGGAVDGGAVTGAIAAPPPVPLDVSPTPRAEPPVAVGGPVVGGPVVGGVVGVVKSDFVDDGPQRPCPACGENIKAAAKKCKFCGEFLDPAARARTRGVEHGGHLASIGARFGARMIDGLIEGVPAGGLFMGGIVAIDASAGNNPGLGLALMGVGLFYMLCITAYQWYVISTRGQTIGKGIVGVRIVKLDGSPVDFVTGVILRNWVSGAIGMVPYIGGCVVMVGYLMILAQDRKCLHDHIASTVVIDA